MESIGVELQKIKDAKKFFEKNKSVLTINMRMVADESQQEEYLKAIERLDYAAQGVKRMLSDANAAMRSAKLSEKGAARYNKTMWQRERAALQKRVREQRGQLESLIKHNKELMEATQSMLEDRVRLMTQVEALKEEVTALRHSWPDGHMCEGCPKEEGCLHHAEACDE